MIEVNKFQARFIESVLKRVIDGIEKNKNKFSFKKYRFLYFKNCLSNTSFLKKVFPSTLYFGVKFGMSSTEINI